MLITSISSHNKPKKVLVTLASCASLDVWPGIYHSWLTSNKWLWHSMKLGDPLFEGKGQESQRGRLTVNSSTHQCSHTGRNIRTAEENCWEHGKVERHDRRLQYELLDSMTWWWCCLTYPQCCRCGRSMSLLSASWLPRTQSRAQAFRVTSCTDCPHRAWLLLLCESLSCLSEIVWVIES